MLAIEVYSVMNGTGLYLIKRGSDGITSCFVAMRTNLPSYSLTHIDGMESTGSESVSLSTSSKPPLLY